MTAPPGLCGACRHSRVIETRRGATFRLCERSTLEPDRYPRYPALPVIDCAGFETATSLGAAPDADVDRQPPADD
jgi:hypothetical protein